jgi:hypothetical protein
MLKNKKMIPLLGPCYLRERVYEIICANLEPGSLLLPPLRAINAIKELPLYEWITEMGAIYFDISPEMGLQAQQDFQTHSLVYVDLYTIISSFALSTVYTAAISSFTYSSWLTRFCKRAHITCAACVTRSSFSPSSSRSLGIMGVLCTKAILNGLSLPPVPTPRTAAIASQTSTLRSCNLVSARCSS